MIGKTVSHYKIVSKIGEGGMGEVFLAEDTQLKRQVAIKFLPMSVANDTDALNRFKREAQATAALHHPNIITIHEFGRHEERPYFVMAYIDGDLLGSVIASGNMNLRRALDLAGQVAEGLAAAHEAGIVHRDVKPDNILLDRRGGVHLLDFGLAKLHGSVQVTQEQSTLGTLNYMSPEQTRGEDLDHRTDIFSFGALLYEMITGRRPFRGEHREAIAYSIATETPEPLARYANDVPDELQRLVSKCLAKDAAQRYASMRDLIVDLTAIQVMGSHASAIHRAPRAGAARAGKWLIIPIASIVALVGAVGLWYGLRDSGAPADEAAEIPVTSSPATPPAQQMAVTPKSDTPRVVVLPFENLGAPEDTYFADGMTEEITSRLANVRELGVISRTSATEYNQTGKTMKDIGLDLGADYVLEGTVRWAHTADGANRVRITPQLIRVSDDTHLWTERYDRVIDDIFEVQSDIASKVIAELGVTLLEPERQAVTATPTDNMDAYNAYLRGKDYVDSFVPENMKLAVDMFERAVDEDPQFVQAWCALARGHALLVHFGLGEEGQSEEARRAADRAMELAPESPDARVASGYVYYHAHKEYARAEAEFAIAEKSRPNDVVMLRGRALVQRRQNMWEESTRNFRRAAELAPRDTPLLFDLADNYFQMRRYATADSIFDRVLHIRPDMQWAYLYKWLTIWNWTGDPAAARAVLESGPPSGEAMWLASWYWQEVREGHYDAAIDHITRMTTISASSGTHELVRPLYVGMAQRWKGDTAAARESFERARAHLETELKHTGEGRLHSALAVTYGALGNKEAALRHIDAAQRWLPLEKDWIWGPTLQEVLAWAYTEAGEYERAIDTLELILSINSSVDRPLLRADPRWDPLRDHPRFQQLVGE